MRTGSADSASADITPKGTAAPQGRWRSIIRRIFTLALASLGALLLIVTYTPLVPAWASRLSLHWTPPQGDVLIVLAGSGADGQMLGYSSYLRSKYALLTYTTGGFHTIVISGGGYPVATSAVMREFLACSGLAGVNILTEEASTSTRENALASAAILRALPGRKVLLTSDYHMFRAMRAFAKAGIEVTPQPFPDIIKRSTNRAERWPAFFELLKESAKIGYYYARGWI